MTLALRNFLEHKLAGEVSVLDYIEGVPAIVEYYLIKSLYYTDEVVVARPFTRQGWILAMRATLGAWIDSSRLVVYYSEESPSWTASTLVRELARKAIRAEHGEALGASEILEETLAHLASYKSNFESLHSRGDSEIVEMLSRDRVAVPRRCEPLFKYDLAHFAIPRILASGLVSYDYKRVVERAISGLDKIFELWLSAKPSAKRVAALSNALGVLGYDPAERGLPRASIELVRVESGSCPRRVFLGGVDGKYLEMMEALRRAAEDPGKIEEILGPWWNDLRDLGEVELLRSGFVPPEYYAI